MNAFSIQEKLAWQTAYQLRNCPGDALLFSGKATKNKELQAHIAQCSFCAERLQLDKDTRSAFATFASQFGKGLQQPDKPHPEAGQVWSLSGKNAGWGAGNRYFNPPRVLLLKRIDDAKGFIAAQLFAEKALMGAGDVWLSDSYGFAESWNAYSVHEDILDLCWGEVAANQLADVCHAAGRDWEASPEGSILQSFRQIEVSVASFFSMQAAAQLAAEYEAAPELSEVLAGALQKVKAFIRELSFGDIDLLGQNFALAGATRGADELDPETAAKLAQLHDDEAVKLLPIDHGQFKDSRYKLKFQNLTWLSEEPVPVQVTVRGEVVEDVQWEGWGTDETWLVLNDTVISGDKIQAERVFLSVLWDESGINIIFHL